jgi:hypothetical protein
MKRSFRVSRLVLLAIAALAVAMVVGTAVAYAATVEVSPVPIGTGAAGTVELISADTAGQYPDASGNSTNSDISADGSVVAFQSTVPADELDAAVVFDGNADGTPGSDIFVRDRILGTTELVSAAAGSVLTEVGPPVGSVAGNGESENPSISDDGRWVAFQSTANNLVEDDENGSGIYDIFVRDLLSEVTTLMSVSSGGNQGNANSARPSVASDGERVYVAYQSAASNLLDLGADNNDVRDVFVSYFLISDSLRQVTTELVSRKTNGNLGSYASGDPSISADGRFVAYESNSHLDSDTTGWDTDDTSTSDIYVTEWESTSTAAATPTTTKTRLVSVRTGGGTSNHARGCFNPSISADGSTVAYDSEVKGLVSPADANFISDVFVTTDWNLTDPTAIKTVKASVNTSGGEASAQSEFATLSGDGRYVTFESNATDLLPAGVDTNGRRDIFVRDLQVGKTYRISTDFFGSQVTPYRRSGEDVGTNNGPAITASYGDVIPQVSFYSQSTNLTIVTDGLVEDESSWGIDDDVFVGTINTTPTITSIDPVSGPTAGGTTVYIYGTNFVGMGGVLISGIGPGVFPLPLVCPVTFGGVDALSWTRFSTMKLIATSPAHDAGTVQVQVTAVGGKTADTAADDYTYIAPVVPPVIPPVIPGDGGDDGGTTTPVETKKGGHIRYEQDNEFLLYAGTWDQGEGDGFSEKSELSTKDKGASITITFEGTRLDWIAALGPLFGKVMVSVDGGEPVEVDLYSATELLQQVVWSTGDLEYGVHVIKIYFPEDLDASQLKPINIDALDVYGGVLLDSNKP